MGNPYEEGHGQPALSQNHDNGFDAERGTEIINHYAENIVNLADEILINGGVQIPLTDEHGNLQTLIDMVTKEFDGINIDSNNVLTFSQEIIAEARAESPSEFTYRGVYDSDEPQFTISPYINEAVYTVGGEALNINNGVHKIPTVEDLQDVLTTIRDYPRIAAVFIPFEPIKADNTRLTNGEKMLTAIESSCKHVIGKQLTPDDFYWLLEQCNVSEEQYRRNPFFSVVASIDGPTNLTVDPTLLMEILQNLELGIPVHLSDSPQLGTNSPATELGGLTQALTQMSFIDILAHYAHILKQPNSPQTPRIFSPAIYGMGGRTANTETPGTLQTAILSRKISQLTNRPFNTSLGGPNGLTDNSIGLDPHAIRSVTIAEIIKGTFRHFGDFEEGLMTFTPKKLYDAIDFVEETRSNGGPDATVLQDLLRSLDLNRMQELIAQEVLSPHSENFIPPGSDMFTWSGAAHTGRCIEEQRARRNNGNTPDVI